MLQERCRPLAQSGVIKAPRVQLENGLLRTKQKPTSLPTLHDNTSSRGAAKKFHTRRAGTTGEQLEKNPFPSAGGRPCVPVRRSAAGPRRAPPPIPYPRAPRASAVLLPKLAPASRSRRLPAPDTQADRRTWVVGRVAEALRGHRTGSRQAR